MIRVMILGFEIMPLNSCLFTNLPFDCWGASQLIVAGIIMLWDVWRLADGSDAQEAAGLCGPCLFILFILSWLYFFFFFLGWICCLESLVFFGHKYNAIATEKDFLYPPTTASFQASTPLFPVSPLGGGLFLIQILSPHRF